MEIFPRVSESSIAKNDSNVYPLKITNSHYLLLNTHSSNPPLPPPPSIPSVIKRGIDFLKFGSKGGDEIYFLKREGLTKGGDCLRGISLPICLNFRYHFLKFQNIKSESHSY